MKIYLCSPTAMAQDMENRRTILEQYGHEITSRWHQGLLGLPRLEMTDILIKERARDDLHDIEQAELVIGFTANGFGRGGRHFELGYAFALNKFVWIVGKPEHAFHTVANKLFPNWHRCMSYLERNF